MGNKAYKIQLVYEAIVAFKETHDGQMPKLRDLSALVEERTGVKITPQWANYLIDDLVEMGKLKDVDGYICVVGAHWQGPD